MMPSFSGGRKTKINNSEMTCDAKRRKKQKEKKEKKEVNGQTHTYTHSQRNSLSFIIGDDDDPIYFTAAAAACCCTIIMLVQHPINSNEQNVRYFIFSRCLMVVGVCG